MGGKTGQKIELDGYGNRWALDATWSTTNVDAINELFKHRYGEPFAFAGGEINCISTEYHLNGNHTHRFNSLSVLWSPGELVARIEVIKTAGRTEIWKMIEKDPYTLSDWLKDKRKRQKLIGELSLKELQDVVDRKRS